MAAPHNSDHHTASWHQNKYLQPEKDGGKKNKFMFTKDVRGSLMLACEIKGYLGFTSRLQLVFVVAETFVIETYIFCQGADLL